MSMSNGVKNLRYYRQLDGATLLDSDDRYYRLDDKGERVYGYRTHFTALMQGDRVAVTA